MNMNKQIAALSLLLAGLSLSALADDNSTPVNEASKAAVSDKREANIDRHGAKQDARIKNGVKSGQLTTKEASTLEGEHKGIQDQEAIAKSDGKISAKEDKHIKARQKVASRKIYSAKHNEATNPKK